MIEAHWKEKLTGEPFNQVNLFITALRDNVMKTLKGRLSSIETSSIQSIITYLEKNIYSIADRDDEEYKRIFLMRN